MTQSKTCAARSFCTHNKNKSVSDTSLVCYTCDKPLHQECGTPLDWQLDEEDATEEEKTKKMNKSLNCLSCVDKAGDCAADSYCQEIGQNTQSGVNICRTCKRGCHAGCVGELSADGSVQCLKCQTEHDGSLELAGTKELQTLTIQQVQRKFSSKSALHPSQVGVDKGGFEVAHLEYMKMDGNIQALEHQLLHLNNDLKARGLSRKDKTDLDNKMKKVRQALQQAKGMGGDSAINALLHQHNGIEALVCSEHHPSSTNHNVNERAQDDKAKTFFYAKLSRQACAKIGVDYPRFEMVTKPFVTKNFCKQYIETMQASHFGYYPLGAGGNKDFNPAGDETGLAKFEVLSYQWRPSKGTTDTGEGEGAMVVKR